MTAESMAVALGGKSVPVVEPPPTPTAPPQGAYKAMYSFDLAYQYACGTCPKCAEEAECPAETFSPRYVGPSAQFAEMYGKEEPPDHEHLLWSCMVCGFSYTSYCADAPEQSAEVVGQ